MSVASEDALRMSAASVASEDALLSAPVLSAGAEEEVDFAGETCSGLLVIVNWHSSCDMTEAPPEVRWVLGASSGVRYLKPWVSVIENRRAVEEGFRKYKRESNLIFFNLVYCQDFPTSYLPSLRVRCASPSLCRENHSAIVWKPDILYPTTVQDRETEAVDGVAVIDVYERLGSEVLQAMQVVSKHLRQVGRPAGHMKRKLSTLDSSLEHVISLLGVAHENLSATNVSHMVLRPATQQLNLFMRADVAGTYKLWTTFSEYMSDSAAAYEFAPSNLRPGFGAVSYTHLTLPTNREV